MNVGNIIEAGLLDCVGKHHHHGYNYDVTELQDVLIQPGTETHTGIQMDEYEGENVVNILPQSGTYPQDANEPDVVSNSKAEVSVGGDGMVPKYAQSMVPVSVVETKELLQLAHSLSDVSDSKANVAVSDSKAEVAGGVYGMRPEYARCVLPLSMVEDKKEQLLLTHSLSAVSEAVSDSKANLPGCLKDEMVPEYARCMLPEYVYVDASEQLQLHSVTHSPTQHVHQENEDNHVHREEDADVASVSLVEDVRDTVPVHQETVRGIEEMFINDKCTFKRGGWCTNCERFGYKVIEAKKTWENWS